MQMTPHTEMAEKLPVLHRLGSADRQVGIVAEWQRGRQEKFDGFGRMPDTGQHAHRAQRFQTGQPTPFSESVLHVLETCHGRSKTSLPRVPASNSPCGRHVDRGDPRRRSIVTAATAVFRRISPRPPTSPCPTSSSEPVAVASNMFSYRWRNGYLLSPKARHNSVPQQQQQTYFSSFC